jgi:hypothetical protein
MGDYRQGIDWWMNLLTACTHQSHLQVITLLSLISTFYKSSQHLLSLFQPAVSSPVVPWQRFLRVEMLQLHAFTSLCYSSPCRTLVNSQLNYSAISSQPPLQGSTDWLPQFSSFYLICTDWVENTVSNSNLIVVEACLTRCWTETAFLLLLRVCMFLALPSNGRCL